MVSWTVIATTGERFSSFGPYVASVNEAGAVAFQAVRSDGGTGVFTGSGEDVAEIALPSFVVRVKSHPDTNDEGVTSFYGELADGAQAVFVVRGGRMHSIAERSTGFSAIGPAGPTMNEAGMVAFRADRADRSGLFVWDGGAVATIAQTGDDWSEFHGLPVVDEHGSVVFRADRPDGTAGIYRAEKGSVRAVVETVEEFQTIGLFPSVASDGSVVFAATLHDDVGGVFRARDDDRIAPVQTDGAFESYRGALICDAGVVRIATPNGGTLGLFAGPDPQMDRILAVGDPLFGSTVEEFAANPVSVNAAGYLAVRLTLADGRGLIARCQPVRATSSGVRHAARIVLVDADERVLLFGFRDPTTGNEFWATTGGGIEPGESALEAARREYGEETGHEAPRDLGPVVWHRTTGFEWDGAWMQADEVFFYQRVDGLAVSEAHVETLQTEGVIGHRWLSLDELRGSDLEVYPVGLADLLGDLLANGPPDQPIELRESS